MKQSTSPNIVDNSLASFIVNTLQNDARLKELYVRLAEIHSKSIPIVVQVSPNEFKSRYSDEVQRLIDLVHQEIELRQRQILEHYTKQKGIK